MTLTFHWKHRYPVKYPYNSCLPTWCAVNDLMLNQASTCEIVQHLCVTDSYWRHLMQYKKGCWCRTPPTLIVETQYISEILTFKLIMIWLIIRRVFLALIDVTSSDARQWVALYQVQCRAPIDVLFYSDVIFPKILPSCGCSFNSGY
jgi:hypothetical protein